MPPKNPLPAALLVPPAAFVRDEMAARGLSVVEMARRAQVNVYWIERILRGAPVRHWDAVMLSQALGTTAEFWLALQAQWDEARRPARLRLRNTCAARWWWRARKMLKRW